ncbi:hypothetical protein NPIL_315451, partial [Nephila pilipes]
MQQTRRDNQIKQTTTAEHAERNASKNAISCGSCKRLKPTPVELRTNPAETSHTDIKTQHQET